MRILKVVQFYHPFQEMGGPVVKVRALAEALAERGHAITVLTADWGLSSRNLHGPTLERCRWGWRAMQQNVETVYLSSIAHYRALTLNPRLVGFCEASLEGFDLVHFYGLYDLLGPAVGFYCRRRSLPYMVEPLGMYRPIDRGLRRKALWHRSLGRAFCEGARTFVATADLEQQTLIEDGISPGKIVVRYNGVDSNIGSAANAARGRFRAKWAVPPDEPVILFLSRLIPRKGADILIDAFARSYPRSGRLIIAGPEGEAGYVSQLQTHARKSGVGERVIFAGPVYGEEKAAAFADADLFVLPSRYENFANVAAEAMACGIPVIVSDACGISSLVEGKAGLVIPPRMDSLVEALRRMLHDRELYTHFKAGCREVADQLSWAKLAAQMESYYAQAMAN